MVNFENLPSTNTPINATNLNNIVTDTGWQNVPLVSPTTTTWNPLQYRKINNVVYLRGFISYNATPNWGTTLAQLPVGVRPLYERDLCGRTMDRNAVTVVAVVPSGNINFLYDIGDESHTSTGCEIAGSFIADN